MIVGMEKNMKVEIASVLIPKSDSVRTVGQAKRIAVRKGFTTRHGVIEQPNYFRVPQSDQPMKDFRTAKRKTNGVKLVKGESVK
jgi:hypothetical protein